MSTTYVQNTTVTTSYECSTWSPNAASSYTLNYIVVVVPGTETVTSTVSVGFGQTTADDATSTAAGDASSVTTKQTTSPVATSADHSTSISQSQNSGVSTGAVAGIAVGCAVVGLILGLAAAWLLLCRRRKGKFQQGDLKVIAASPESKDYASVVTSPIGASTSGSDSQLDQFLLAATPDKEMGTELQALGDLIHQHVENHYHVGTATVSSSLLSQCLVNLGFTSGLMADAVAGLCINPKSRQAGLRHVISNIIFKSIDVNSRSSLSMLPAPLAAFLQSIPSSNQHQGSSLTVSVALSKWRRLSTLLLHPNAIERTPLPVSEDVVAPQALALANALNTFLHYFVGADGVSRDQQTSHLQAVIIECTKLGYVILSQPSDWQFVFGTDDASSRQSFLVVCPGLEKLSHGDGSRYSSPRQVVEPIVIPA